MNLPFGSKRELRACPFHVGLLWLALKKTAPLTLHPRNSELPAGCPLPAALSALAECTLVKTTTGEPGQTQCFNRKFMRVFGLLVSNPEHNKKMR